MTARARHALPADVKVFTMLAIAVSILAGVVIYVSGARVTAFVTAVAAVGALVGTLALGARIDLDSKIITRLLIVVLLGELSVVGLRIFQPHAPAWPVAPSPSRFQNVTVGGNFDLSFPVAVSRKYLQVTFQATDANPQAPSCWRNVGFAMEYAQTGVVIQKEASPGVPDKIQLPPGINSLLLSVTVNDGYSDYSDCVVNLTVSGTLTNT